MISPMYHDIFIDSEDSPLEGFQKLTQGPVGYSVARAARILDMTKQSVDSAIRRGSLDATRIYLVAKPKNKLISTEVDRKSVHEYAIARNGRSRVPKGFVGLEQQELPI